MKKKELERQYWLYEYHHKDIESFISHATQVTHGNSRIMFNILRLSGKEDLAKLFEQWRPKSFRLKIVNKGPVMSIKVANVPKDNYEIQREVTAVILRHPSGLYLVISDCTRSDFANIITEFLRRYHPDIARVYLTNKELYDILEKFEKEELKIRVDRMTAYSRLETSKKKRVAVTYTAEPFRKVFTDAAEFSQWIDKIKFTAYTEKITQNGSTIRKRELVGYISRSGFFRVRQNFKLFYAISVELATKVCIPRINYLKVRSEKARDQLPEPLVIKYDRPIITSPDDNKRLISILADLRACSISTYHANPYIHLSLLDYLDGSSYDIWVLSPDDIIVVPQLTASVASMTRLINHIFERFEEGKIVKYEPIQVPNA